MPEFVNEKLDVDVHWEIMSLLESGSESSENEEGSSDEAEEAAAQGEEEDEVRRQKTSTQLSSLLFSLLWLECMMTNCFLFVLVFVCRLARSARRGRQLQLQQLAQS